ncbi:galactose mutarotase-like domain-containing protein [Pyronema omphalodes]|nr:galactose mutarotase-like domain-containing protein [Pyronema omphalodes]
MVNPINIIPRGATIQLLPVGRNNFNIVLNFNTEEQYSNNPGYFGETIGRVANRIKKAVINNLDGRRWELKKNNGENSLHGGVCGWGQRIWDGPREVEYKEGMACRFDLTSTHLEEMFPGEVKAAVVYRIRDEGLERRIEVEYEAELVGGAEETCINMTNHSYFNLSGGETIAGTIGTLATNLHLPLDATGIPIDESSAPYPGISTNQPFELTATGPNIDDCFVFPDSFEAPDKIPIDTRSLPLRTLASFYHPDTKIHLRVESTEPAFQFYTGQGNMVDERSDGSPKRLPRSGFCVEPSRFVDAVNRPVWRNMVVLKKGEKYGSKIVYTAWEE